MKMSITTDEWRAYMIEFRVFSTDAQGREVLVGLTHDETKEFFALLMQTRSSNKLERFYILKEVHEIARQSVVDAEEELRATNPTVN